MLVLPSTPQGLTKPKADLLYQPLGSYAALAHTHDDRYYTEAEITTLIAGLSSVYAALVHTHAAADIVSGTLDNARVNWGAPGAIGSTTPAAITGTALVGTTLGIAPDTDASTILGRARVDSRATDILYLSHYDLTTVANYALNQTSGGITTVNAASGQVVRLAIGGTTLVSLLSTSLSALPDTDATTILGRTRIDSRSSDLAYFSHYDQSGVNSYAIRQNASGATRLNGASGQDIRFSIGGTGIGLISAAGWRIGDESAAASSMLHALTSDAVTNAITTVLTLGHNSSGTPAASFGTGLLFQGESSTTENRDMGRIRTLWTTATDASRVSNMVLSVVNSGTETDILTLAPSASGIIGSIELTTTNFTPKLSPTNPTTEPGFRFRSDEDTGLGRRAADEVAIYTGGQPRIVADSTGKVGVGVSASLTALLDINSDVIRLRTAKTPASAAAAGNQGDHAWDADYVYVCVATNTWKRAALSTW
jgi:hypothetical protein